MGKLRPHMGRTLFTTWMTAGATLPIGWDEAIERLLGPRPPRAREPDEHQHARAARLGMAAAMAFAGASHWFMPPPSSNTCRPGSAADALIAITGFVEVALGAALLLQQPWRRGTCLALAAYLVSVFPANAYVADVDIEGQPGGWYAWLRLPMQALFVAWALWSTRQLCTHIATLFGTEPGSRLPSRAARDVRGLNSSSGLVTGTLRRPMSHS